MNAHQLWTDSGEFTQDLWITVYEWFGSDPHATWLWGSFMITFLVYWITGLCFTVVDLTGKPAFVLQYKIQDTSNYPVPITQVLKVTKNVLINQILVSIPFMHLVSMLMIWRGADPGQPVPSFHRILLHLLLFVLIEEFGFYYSHRLLHLPRFYKYIHKRHHEWTSPISITAMYCHPVEMLLSNLLPVLLGPFVLGSHPLTSWLWFSMAVFNTVNTHSGYHLPLMPSPEAHDFHHVKFNENFGVLGLLDGLHGTNSQFLSSKNCQRNFSSLSLVPLRQLYPDEPKKK